MATNEMQEVNVLKKQKLNDDVNDDEHDDSNYFCSLPEDILLTIFKILNGADLLALSRVCQRFEDLLLHHQKLWEKLDFRGQHVLLCQVWPYLKFLNSHTQFLATWGPSILDIPDEKKWEEGIDCLTPAFLRAVAERCTHLQSFVVQNHCFDGSQVKLEYFPSSLLSLTFDNCVMKNVPKEYSYFTCISLYMPNLQVLKLKKIPWFTCHSFFAICKLANLRELRITDSKTLSDCVAYLSISARLGFEGVKIVDFSHTDVGDREISCLNYIRSLTHLYLENNDTGDSTSEDDSDNPCISKSIDELLKHTHEKCVCFEKSNTPTAVNQQKESSGESSNVNETSNIITVDVGINGNAQEPFVSDLMIHAFLSGAEFLPPFLTIGPVSNTPKPKLHTLVVRHYKRITDHALEMLGPRMSSLKYLDVTGTSVTQNGIDRFVFGRPDVTVVSDFGEIKSDKVS